MNGKEVIQGIRAAAFRKVCENHLPLRGYMVISSPQRIHNKLANISLLQVVSNAESMQLPSGPTPHIAFGGATDLEDQDGQNLLESAASEAAPSPAHSPTQNASAEQDKGPKFGPADRSCDHFWPLSIRPFDLCARTPRPRSFGGSIGPEPPFHHINFLGEKIFVRSATPPEVSYWAAFLSTYTKPHRTFSRKGVIVAQANKYIDPFRYIQNGSESAMEELCGNALLAALDGRVEKAYPNRGSWLEEKEGDGDEPIRFDEHDLKTEPIYFWKTVPNHGLHRPHRMNKRDQHDMVINGPRNFTPPASRSYKNVARKHLTRPSGLRKIAGSEEQEDLVDEVDAWGFDRSQRWYANFAAKASRLSSVMAVGDRDVDGPVEADTNPNPTGANAQGSVGQSGVELGAEELAVAQRELEMLGMEEDSDSSDSEDDDFYDENIEFSDEDEDTAPCVRERHIGSPASEAPTGIDSFPPMQINGPQWPNQPVAERANNGHAVETLHGFSEERDVGLHPHSNHGAELVHHPLPLLGVGAQFTSSFGFETTIPASTEEGLALPNTSANPIQQQGLLSCAAHVETVPHETLEERRARHQDYIERRQQHLPTLATDNQQQQLIRPEPEEKHQIGRLEFIKEERKAAAMLTASALERGDGGVRDIKTGARRSTMCRKNESYLDHPVGGVLWFLFLFVFFLYLWDLLP